MPISFQGISLNSAWCRLSITEQPLCGNGQPRLLDVTQSLQVFQSLLIDLIVSNIFLGRGLP